MDRDHGPPASAISRRELLLGIAAGLAALGCRGGGAGPIFTLPAQTPGGDPEVPYADATDALWDAILPAERDAAGATVSPGARECGVDDVLVGQNPVRAAIALGLLPRQDEATVALFDDFAARARVFLNAELDALAQLERPLGTFATLSPAARDRVLAHALDDDRLGPPLLAARAACFLAYLGAVTSDLGLRAVGLPPFEDFADRRATSGYADYTFDRAPTAGVDVSALVDANGDLR